MEYKINTNKSSPYKVLLIEDDDMSKQITKRILQETNCLVDAVTTGKKGLELYKNRDYQLVLMDINLPDINGIELCKKMSNYAKKKNKHVTIVALTAFGDLIEEDCKKAGFNKVYIKPLMHKELMSLVSC